MTDQRKNRSGGKRYGHTDVPPPADEGPIARLAHTVAIFSEGSRPTKDDEWVVTATSNVYSPGERTGLTWGDLRALYELLRRDAREL